MRHIGLGTFCTQRPGRADRRRFTFKNWHYLVEARWRKRKADAQDLDGLQGKVSRSGKQTMGMFLSIEGWSEHVVPLLKQNTSKAIILMDGYDLRTVLEEQTDLAGLLDAKVTRLNLFGEPFFSAAQYIRSQDR